MGVVAVMPTQHRVFVGTDLSAQQTRSWQQLDQALPCWQWVSRYNHQELPSQHQNIWLFLELNPRVKDILAGRATNLN